MICNNCGATFVEREEGYELKKIKNKKLPAWEKYGGKILKEHEWKNIAEGGVSDEEQKEMDISKLLTALKNGEIAIEKETESSIILRKGEEHIISFPNIRLYEARKIRRAKGRYGGPSIKLAKGFYLRLGSFDSQSESSEQLKEIDVGVLSLTSKRLVFSGEKKTINIPLTNIISIDPYIDGIAVRSTKRSRTSYFIGTDQKTIVIKINDREYEEKFSGLFLKYLIEGQINKIE